MIIGLTGGVGCGKSTIMQILKEEYGAIVLMADELGREAMQPGTSVYWDIVRCYGEVVLDENQEIDRTWLAKRLFRNQVEMKQQNERIHPYVRKKIEDVIRKSQGDASLFVIESAILLQAGYRDMCDEIWYVYASIECRSKRLEESRGYSAERIQAIMENQWSEERFRKECTHIIDNEGTLEKVREQLHTLLS